MRIRFGWAIAVGIFALGFVLYWEDNRIESKEVLVARPGLQNVANKDFLSDATVASPDIGSSAFVGSVVSPEIGLIAFVGVAYSVSSHIDSIALLKVGDRSPQPFRIGDNMSKSLMLRDIQPEKVLISSLNGYPDFEVLLTYPSTEVSQASRGDASANASAASRDVQMLPGFVKGEQFARPQDEKTVAANNAAFLRAVQAMKRN